MSKNYTRRGFRRKNQQQDITTYYEANVNITEVGDVKLVLNTKTIENLYAYRDVLESERHLKEIDLNTPFQQVRDNPVVKFYFELEKEINRREQLDSVTDRDEFLAELKQAVKDGEITKAEMDEELEEFEEDIKRRIKTESDMQRDAVLSANSYFDGEIKSCAYLAFAIALLDKNFRVERDGNLSQVRLADHLTHFRLTPSHFEDSQVNQQRLEQNRFPYPPRNRYSVVEQKVAYLNIFTQQNGELFAKIVEVMQNFQELIQQGGNSSANTEVDEQGFHPEQLEGNLAEAVNADS